MFKKLKYISNFLRFNFSQLCNDNDYCTCYMEEQTNQSKLTNTKDRISCGTHHCDERVWESSAHMQESTRELDIIEKRAINLWQSNNNCVFDPPIWWDLKSWQKLPFYWAALSNEMLFENPRKNFERLYNNNKQLPKRRQKRRKKRAYIVWKTMSTNQRLPFVLEAFISKVGAGKVNMRDEHEIQRVIAELLTY